jgi:hypothetical protein
MKTFSISFQKSIPLFIIGMFVLILTSCGTHNSGYSSTDRTNDTDEATSTNEDTEASENNKSNYYKQYFKSKESAYAGVLEEETEEGAIFTDIDAYHSSETLGEDGYVIIEEKDNEYEEGYGAWGSNSDNVTINVYGGHNGYNYGYWNRPFSRYGNSWGYPFYRPFWGVGLGWGNPYWGGHYYPYNQGYYGYANHYNHYNSYAYNRGRSNTGISSRNSRGRSSNVASRRGNYSRSEVTRRSNSNVSRRSKGTTNTRPTQNTTRRKSANVNTNRKTSPNKTVRRSNTTRRSNNYSRPATNVRRSSPSRSNGGSSRGSSGKRGRG